VALQRLGKKKLRKLSQQHEIEFLVGLVEHNHKVTLYSKGGEVFSLHGGRLTHYTDPGLADLGKEVLQRLVHDGDS
jgi:hypothetical protein